MGRGVVTDLLLPLVAALVAVLVLSLVFGSLLVRRYGRWWEDTPPARAVCGMVGPDGLTCSRIPHPRSEMHGAPVEEADGGLVLW
jgi:hypothetical protein